MKKLEVFITNWCPHCKKAKELLQELRNSNPAWAAVLLRYVDEEDEKAYADAHDYYYVPSFYIDGVKIHEGKVDKDEIRKILDRAKA